MGMTQTSASPTLQANMASMAGVALLVSVHSFTCRMLESICNKTWLLRRNNFISICTALILILYTKLNADVPVGSNDSQWIDDISGFL